MRVLVLLAMVTVISACGARDPQAAYERRQALIAEYLPAPADRVGIDFVYPIFSRNEVRVFLVEYFPGQVDENTVVTRLAKACTRNRFLGADGSAHIDEAPEDTMIGRPDGTTVPGKKMVVRCGQPS